MSDTENAETAPPPAEPVAAAVVDAPTAFPQPIDEFCQNLSAKVRLPELIYAFSKHEIANGRGYDTAKNYMDRFAAFGGRVPV